MRNGAALAAAVASAPRSPFRTLTYRAIHLKHFPTLAAAQPLFAPPGGAVGSRYVAPRGPESLHVAPSADTAFREMNQDFIAVASTIPGAALIAAGLLRPQSCVTLGIRVDVSHVLDLTERAVRLHLGIAAAAALTGRWRGVPNAATQVLGSAVFASARFEGILYPSARHRGHPCLVLFIRLIAAPSRVDFRDVPSNVAGQLP